MIVGSGDENHFWRFCAHATCACNFTCLTPPPPPIQCWKLVLTISPDFQHCIGWGGGRQHVFKRIEALLSNFSCKTQSLLLLSTIVVFFHRFRHCDAPFIVCSGLQFPTRPQLTPGDGEGLRGTPEWKGSGVDAGRKFWIHPLKETNLGVATALFTPGRYHFKNGHDTFFQA